MKKIILTLCAVGVFIASHAQTYNLKLNPVKDKVVPQQMTVDMNTNGAQISLNIFTEIKNIAKRDTILDYESTIKEVTMQVDAGFMKMSYDSKNPGTDPFSTNMDKTMGQIVNKTIKSSLSEHGNVIDMQFPKEINNPVLDKNLFRNGNIILPYKPVAIGDSWTAVKVQDDMKYQSTNTLKEVTADYYGIEQNIEIFDSNGTPSGTLKGNYHLNKQTCETMSGLIDMLIKKEGVEISGKVTIK